MATGMRTPYTDSNRKKILVANAIDQIDWMEAPLLYLLGTDNAGKFGLPEVGTKYEWNTDTMSPRSGTLNEALDDSETGVDVQTGEGNYVKKGDVIRVDDELMWVEATSANSITTVIRGWGDSVAATHLDDAPWEIYTASSISGDEAVTGHTTTMNRIVNYTATLKEAIKVAGDEEDDPKYDAEGTMVYHMKKLFGEGGKSGKLPIMLEGIFKQPYASADANPEGSATVARYCKGFNSFVTTNVTDLSSAALTRTHIEDSLQDCYEAGGSPETLIVPAWGKRKITSFYEKYITTKPTDRRGGGTITTVMSDFGEVEVVYWRWCPSNVIYMLEKQQVGWITKRPWQITEKASTGDYALKEVLGEFGFVVRNEKAHAIIKNFSTTA